MAPACEISACPTRSDLFLGKRQMPTRCHHLSELQAQIKARPKVPVRPTQKGATGRIRGTGGVTRRFTRRQSAAREAPVAEAALRHFTLNLGPQHPAPHR